MARRNIQHVTFDCSGESSEYEPCDIIANGGCSTWDYDLTVEADSIEELFQAGDEMTAEELVVAFLQKQDYEKNNNSLVE